MLNTIANHIFPYLSVGMEFLIILFAFHLSLCPCLLDAIVRHTNGDVFSGCNCVAKYMCSDNNNGPTDGEFEIK